MITIPCFILIFLRFTNKLILTLLSILTLLFIVVGLIVSIMQYYGISKVSLHEPIKVEILPKEFQKEIKSEVESASNLDKESHKGVPTMKVVFGNEKGLPNSKELKQNKRIK
jgi:hypothetical protein